MSYALRDSLAAATATGSFANYNACAGFDSPSVIESRRTSSATWPVNTSSLGYVRRPLLSRSRSSRFISGVSPIDGLFAGVCSSVGLLTLLGDSGGGKLCFYSSSAGAVTDGCVPTAVFDELCA